jgi:hypothetical protein
MYENENMTTWIKTRQREFNTTKAENKQSQTNKHNPQKLKLRNTIFEK